MRFLSIVGNSFGCSASGERLVSAARDGDLQEAKALLECNPRLARYSTFGLRNSPLHYSAAQGHHEIVSLLLESGVDINLRNYCGQTALMQACRYGHWEVVQTLVLFKANVHKADYLNGRTALHFAAVNGHSRCVRLLLADYVPSIPEFWNISRRGFPTDDLDMEFETSSLSKILNKPADGGITALHMAALNGHVDSLQLLLDLGACISVVTIDDGTTIDLIGAGSTPLHYAACGGNAQCCQFLVARGAILSAENSNGWTPLQVARLWHRQWLEGILSRQSEARLLFLPSRYLSLPLMSIVKISRECGWRSSDILPACVDPCAVCLERRCTVAAEGCNHEFCTQCALYLCSTNNTSTVSGPPGSIACPLCRHGIVSFIRLPHTSQIRELPRMSLSLSLCTACSGEATDPTTMPPFSTMAPLRSSSVRSLSCQNFPSVKLNSSLCMRAPRMERKTHKQVGRCAPSGLRGSASQRERRSTTWV
ncbi:probable E3 ubiquitin-protein ligase XBOS32 isoform X1 [Amborella trichopoda]|uniref:probable E3 ubiquitin-protein ligase XBOS32 isoform X1 n=1 Tax=Amborella trichopoda TaxID=13333 RepID=UPI0005D41005|nr:probable E3 ubiquitin-protein ligase XBOS32 isoform X1 [Amborella trichopoda]|eukprot:XP_006845489.2 probable E3 ubiquitin-protein ligase XBOS32 isoform X1 [Amborella trichopoda]